MSIFLAVKCKYTQLVLCNNVTPQLHIVRPRNIKPYEINVNIIHTFRISDNIIYFPRISLHHGKWKVKKYSTVVTILL